jgi:uncharacterized membrane protein HdeD (DUF308 family)
MSGAVAPASWLKEAKKNSGWITALGVVQVIVGVLALGSPLVAGIAAAVVAGVFLSLAGVIRIFAAFKAGSWGAGIFGLLVGILTVLGGLLIMVNPLFGLASLTLLLAIYFLIEGISVIMLGFKMKPAKGWGWTLFSGLVTLFLGGLIWSQWPLSGVWAVGTLLGIHLIFDGWAEIAVASAARAAVPEGGDQQINHPTASGL